MFATIGTHNISILIMPNFSRASADISRFFNAPNLNSRKATGITHNVSSSITVAAQNSSLPLSSFNMPVGSMSV